MCKKDTIELPKAIYLNDYLPSPFLIEKVKLTFILNEDHTEVVSNLTIKRNPESHSFSKDLDLDGESLELVSIKIDNEILREDQYRLRDNACTLLSVPDSFQCEIITKNFPHLNTALSGLYLSNQKYCTQCEAEGFRRITYFLDRPDVLAFYETTIIADKKKYPYLLSNGNLISKEDLDDGRHRVTWHDPFRKPSYLFALVAGDFDLTTDTFITKSNRKISLAIYVEKGYGAETSHAMYALKKAMSWDEDAFNREYDLDHYMIVAINDFNMGAMENKGLNIFNTKYILAKPETATDDDYINILSVIGHEYFHNWSGNRVTCRDWFQLSLKEGLTIFRDQSFSEDMLSKAFIRIREVNSLRQTQFPEDASPLAHPVRPKSYIEINNFYTATIYNKGAEVIRMLQTIIGEEVFGQGMDYYFEKFDGHAATIEDFVSVMENVSKKDLSQFKLWYDQAGTPIVNVEDDYDEKKQVYRLIVNQHTPPTKDQANKEPLHIPIKLGLVDQAGHSLKINEDANENTLVCHLTEASQIFTFNKITAKPIPSLFRHFSAPVKWQYQYSDRELLLLAKYDKDDFNRYEAIQRYILRLLLSLIEDYQHEKNLIIPESLMTLFSHLISDDSLNIILKSEMLVLPSEKYIAEQMAVVDVNAIHTVREFALKKLSYALAKEWLIGYQNANDANLRAEFSLDTIGERQFKNRCLLYLTVSKEYEWLAIKQFEETLGKNMSDTQAAFIAIVNSHADLRDHIITKFYNFWYKDPLVIDKWLAMQASSKSSDTLNQVKKLLRHEAFDIKNPNKVYALIGTLGRNQFIFHSETGEGYAFMREVISQLDKINPQIASRMVQPMTEWQRYDRGRQILIHQQLEILLKEKLSNDLYELVSKSLQLD